MIDRFIFLRLREEHTASQAAFAEHSARVLASLPGVISVSVGAPADEHARAAWDLAIRVRFATLADFEAYRVNPEHRRYVDEYLTPRVQVIKAWNFQEQA